MFYLHKDLDVFATDGSAVGHVDLNGLVLETEALRRIPRSLALGHDVLSLTSDGNQITIAVPEGSNRETIDRVRLATGMHVRALTAPRDVIRERLRSVYPSLSAEAPAVRELDSLLHSAIESGASDVHIEPLRNGGRIRRRIDGMLSECKTLPPDVYGQLVSRVKLLAGMDIADRRQPQDGRYSIEIGHRGIDARVSSVPTTLGEKIVVRLLDHSGNVPTLEHLGMPECYLERFRGLIQAPHGFIVVCGPTGSGKTTTLYAAMSERDVVAENLCSVEDPVEVSIPGIAQVQINTRAGVTFASALRAFLRQDPNVIMVGEMRDDETAAVAAAAALSGQLVMTTLHSNDAPTAIDRLSELGVARHTLASGLTVVLAQRLVRVLCGNCRVPFIIGERLAQAFSIESGLRAYRAEGCGECVGTGYVGRTAIFECIFTDGPIREMVARGESSVTLANAARERGYRPLRDDGLRRVLQGQTSFEELRRVLLVDCTQ